MKLLGSSTTTNYPYAFISHSPNSFSFPSLIKVRLYPSKSSRDTNGSHNFVYQEVQDLNLCFLLFLLYYYYYYFFNLTKYFVPLFQIKKIIKKKNKKKNTKGHVGQTFYFGRYWLKFTRPCPSRIGFIKKKKKSYGTHIQPCPSCTPCPSCVRHKYGNHLASPVLSSPRYNY